VALRPDGCGQHHHDHEERRGTHDGHRLRSGSLPLTVILQPRHSPDASFANDG
jgi:hypothetical protein